MSIKQLFSRKKEHFPSKIVLGISLRDCYGGQFVRILSTRFDAEYKGYDINPQIQTYQFQDYNAAKLFFDCECYGFRQQNNDNRIQNVMALYAGSIKDFYDAYPSDIVISANQYTR